MANDQIKKADNGTYYFRANLGFDHSTGKRIQKYRSGFKTKKEAKEEYAKLVLQFASQSLPTEQKRIPFGTFIEDTYLPWYQTQVKESTFENRASTVRKHFSCFYEKFTDAIEPIDIQNWQLALIRAGYSPNYVRVTQGMLSVAFDRAVILGITERNPSRMVGNVRGQKPLVDFWTLDEFEKVISKLYKGDYYEHYLFISLLFLFMSGMRLGEASALLWSDIDFTTGLCSITKTLYYHNQSDYKFTKPKTRAAIRSIYLDEDRSSQTSQAFTASGFTTFATPTRHFSSTWEKAHCSSRNGSGMRRYRPRLGHMGTCIPIPTKQSQRSSPASSTTVSRRRASRTTRATNTRRTTTVHEEEKTGALPPRSSTRPRPTSRFFILY